MNTADIDLSELLPVIVPLAEMDQTWEGPIEQIGSLPFALTWAVLSERSSRYYVTHEQIAQLQQLGVNWRVLAMSNLVKRSMDQPHTGVRCDDDGKPFIQVLLHDDALGPSRLLIPEFYRDSFGEAYCVAIPEQTCAVVYRACLSDDEANVVDGVIGQCFRMGTYPASDKRFEPSHFWGQACERQS